MSDTHEHHIVTPATYLRVLITLMILMGLTVLAANFEFGHAGNLALALFIAVCKMLTIALFFMHVKYSSKLTMIFAAAGAFWLLIMFALTFADFAGRSWNSAFVPGF
jgi:cytochrome c oxidase subunit 4